MKLRNTKFVLAVLTACILSFNAVAQSPVIDAGEFHSIMLGTNGAVYTAGWNNVGQLGDNGTLDSIGVYTQVTALTGDYIAVSAGKSHCLALKRDLTVWAWGLNTDGQLGDGTMLNRLLPVQVNTITNATHISAGPDYSLALLDDGTVWSWGANGQGQLGDSTTTQRVLPVQTGLTGIAQISAGGATTARHGLALGQDGRVWGWGSNGTGQLGINSTTTPVPIPGVANILTTAVMVSAGGDHSGAIDEKGNVYTWGRNFVGELGNGLAGVGTNVLVPTPISIPAVTLPIPYPADTFALAISCGFRHTIVLQKVPPQNRALVTGLDGDGQQGNGPPLFSNNVLTPTNFIPVGVRAISAGWYSSVAEQALGEFPYVFGRDNYGLLAGNFMSLDQSFPIAIIAFLPPGLIKPVCPKDTGAFSTSITGLSVTLLNTAPTNDTISAFHGSDIFLYDMGDGTREFGPGPTHVYADSGTYTICLTTANGCNRSDSCLTISVTCLTPVAAFTFGASELVVNFTDASVAADMREWDFGDASPVDTSQNPTHTYAAAGTYMVQLKITNKCGVMDVVTNSVTVSCFIAVATFSDSTAGDTTYFSATSPNAVTWSWDFDDGSPLNTTQSPAHKFITNVAEHNVCLTVTNACADPDSFCKLIIGISDQFPGIGNINLYPNPANNQLTVGLDLEKAMDLNIVITNLIGEKMTSFTRKLGAGKQSLNLDTSTLPEGVYLVKFQHGGSSISKQFVKVR